ncbi:MAG TPA: DnaJ domain-containing protein, partial [Kofleriaceae bacterium]
GNILCPEVLEALMGVLARGSVADRPWGMTLGALGLRGLTGQLTLAAQYRIAFDNGAIVGAYSPLANDAVVRLALTGNLITSSQVSDITRRIAAAPHRDEVEVLADALKLQPDQAQRLRRRLVAQRAARTFAIDAGEFVVEDLVTVTVVPGSELDVRTIVFLGARNNLGEDRLASELSQLGVWFKLKPEAVDDLAQFGFSDEEKPILQMLLQGANLADIEAVHAAALGSRTIRAVAYSLASCGACEASTSPGPALARTQSANIPAQQPRAHSPATPPQTVMRAGTAPAAAPAPAAAAETKQHKTAPLGSRSPSSSSDPATRPATGSSPPGGTRASGSKPGMSRAATNPTTGSGVYPVTRPPSGNHRAQTPTQGTAVSRQGTDAPRRPSEPLISRVATPNDPSVGRVPTPAGDPTAPTGPRTITESTGVPRESSSVSNSSGANTAQGGQPAGRDRSPSGGTRTQDRSPSGGVRAQDRSPSGGVARPQGTTRSTPGTTPPLSRTSTNNSPVDGLRPPAEPRTTSSQSMRAFSTSAPPSRPGLAGKPPQIRRKQSTAATLEIEALLQKKIPMLDQGVDYFTLFGLQVGATPDDVRQTYFMLARKLHPDRLAAIGVEDDDRHAQRLMACINEAFAVLNDPVRRAEYMSILNRGGEAAVRVEEQKADEMAMKVMRAEEAFRQGEMSLRREQIAQAVEQFKAAVELAPNEPEYQALLAWAQFANATDKASIANQTRRALIRAAEANDNSFTARFYLGRVERMLGREKEALYCFYEVLRIKPNHSEATSEARILEQRLKARR